MAVARRWTSVIGLIAIAFALFTLLARGAQVASATANCAGGKTMFTDAHEDDSILFQLPDISQSVAAGRCVETVFVTAGDDGLDSSYWGGREAGARAAYAKLAGVANAWTQSDAGIAGHPIPVFTLNAQPAVSVAFMRLPDGAGAGGGFASTGFESLQQVWSGGEPTITAVDGSSSYTKADLVATFAALMTNFQPDTIGTQDFVGFYGDSDHSDHHSVAFITQAAGETYTTPHTLMSYGDYGISGSPANLSAVDTAAKQAVWFAYAPNDPEACQTVAACQANGYANWWSREYVLATVQQPSSGGGGGGGGGTGGSGNVAPNATVTASTQSVASGQTAVKAVDGFTDGCCSGGDVTHEWATTGEGVGAWLNLAWSSPQTLTSVTLFDRPNTDDQITAGTLTFSDGSSVPVGTLPNDGTPLSVSFAAKTVTSVRLTVTGVSATTKNVGLAEFQAFSSGASPPASTLSLSGPASLTAGGSVQLAVQASTGSPSVSLSTSSAGGGFSTSSSGPWTATLSVPTSAGNASFFYRDTKAGSSTVTATATGYTTATQSETITAGALATIAVTPAGPLTLAIGAKQAFTATGADSFGNAVSVSPTWSSTRGTFSPTSGASTTFTAVSAGSGTVLATVGTITDTTTITVTASVTSVTSIAYALANRNLTITATVHNAAGSAVANATVSVTIKRNGVTISTVSAVTGSTGKASFTVQRAASGTYTTVVTSVTATNTTWDGKTPTNSFRV